MDRPMLIPPWQGRKRNAAGELLVLITEREAVNLGAVAPAGEWGGGGGVDGQGECRLVVVERGLSTVSTLSASSQEATGRGVGGRPKSDRAVYVPTDWHPGAVGARTASVQDYEGGEPLVVRVLTKTLGRRLGS